MARRKKSRPGLGADPARVPEIVGEMNGVARAGVGAIVVEQGLPPRVRPRRQAVMEVVADRAKVRALTDRTRLLIARKRVTMECRCRLPLDQYESVVEMGEKWLLTPTEVMRGLIEDGVERYRFLPQGSMAPFAPSGGTRGMHKPVLAHVQDPPLPEDRPVVPWRNHIRRHPGRGTDTRAGSAPLSAEPVYQPPESLSGLSSMPWGALLPNLGDISKGPAAEPDTATGMPPLSEEESAFATQLSEVLD